MYMKETFKEKENVVINQLRDAKYSLISFMESEFRMSKDNTILYKLIKICMQLLFKDDVFYSYY